MKIKTISSALFLILSSCISKTNMPDSESIQKQEVFISPGKSAFIRFKKIRDNRDISVNITWEKNLGREYSEIGPITRLVIQENGKIFENVTNYTLQEIEDVNLDSIKLRSPRIGEYELSMAWGAGEDLYYPRILLVK